MSSAYPGPVGCRAAAHLGVQPLGQALGGLHPEPVHVELLGELAFALEARDQLGHLGADGDALEGHDVAFTGVERAEEVGQADTVVLGLAREGEALELALGVLRVEDDQLVALGDDVFPLARDELSGQLLQLRQPALARALTRSIQERPDISALTASLATSRALTG